MRTILLVISFLIFINDTILAQNFNSKSKRKNSVEKYILAPFVEAIHEDSIKIVTFAEIPYSSLQFIKKGTNYIAKYQVTISLKRKKGDNIYNKVWIDSMVVQSYDDSRSVFKNSKHQFSVNVKNNGHYIITCELQDLDTRKKGVLIKEVDLRKLSKKPNILKPIFLLDLQGDWGFEKDKIPTKGIRVREVGLGVDIILNGFINRTAYEINLYVTNNESMDSLIYHMLGNGKDGYFNHSVFVPSKYLENIKNNFKVSIKQDGKEIDREFVFGTFKSGIASSINDIDNAIKQMKYLLSKEEADMFKSKNKFEREELFNQIWKKLDPTPESDYNELMEEYFKRVDYTNEHFDGWQPGWKTDRGMIYILFGAPDQINRYNSTNNMNKTRQIWYYQKIAKEFSFIDQNGFGDYRLENQFSSNWNF